jgi:hypothetical protein
MPDPLECLLVVRDGTGGVADDGRIESAIAAIATACFAALWCACSAPALLINRETALRDSSAEG